MEFAPTKTRFFVGAIPVIALGRTAIGTQTTSSRYLHPSHA
jgi:hypothetical protein